jgi:hypothetical protein
VSEKFIIDIDDDTTKKEKIREYLDNLEESVDEIVKFGEKNGLKIDLVNLKNRIENVKKIILNKYIKYYFSYLIIK